MPSVANLPAAVFDVCYAKRYEMGTGKPYAGGLPGCRHIAAELRDELLNGEIFYSLKEAQIIIEQ